MSQSFKKKAMPHSAPPTPLDMLPSATPTLSHNPHSHNPSHPTFSLVPLSHALLSVTPPLGHNPPNHIPFQLLSQLTTPLSGTPPLSHTTSQPHNIWHVSATRQPHPFSDTPLSATHLTASHISDTAPLRHAQSQPHIVWPHISQTHPLSATHLVVSHLSDTPTLKLTSLRHTPLSHTSYSLTYSISVSPHLRHAHSQPHTLQSHISQPHPLAHMPNLLQTPCSLTSLGHTPSQTRPLSQFQNRSHNKHDLRQ